MNRCFAFLRAINVGGRTVKMDRLRRLFAEVGLEEVESFIASGNLIFADPGGDTAELESAIETRLEASLGYDVATFVRRRDELAGAATARPFGAGDPSRHYIGFARAAPDAGAIERVVGLGTEADRLAVVGREIHWGCETSSQESPISGAVLERVLAGPLTLRNRNTVDRLLAKYGEPQDA